MNINAQRLWDHLNELGKVGMNNDGSVTRLAYSVDDEKAKELIKKWMVEAELKVEEDAVGNLIATYSSENGNNPPLLIGSHFDSVKEGGRFDGCLGVLSGLEVLQTLKENDWKPERDIKLIGFRDEEGNRFGYGMIGSHSVAGIMDESGLESKDETGTTLNEVLIQNGYHPEKIQECRIEPIYAYLELHIEQASLLQQNHCSVGIVTGIAGLDRYTFTICGQSAHAGATPMTLRKDPVVAMSHWITRITELAEQESSTVATVGSVITTPGACNVICDKVEFTLDIRSLFDETRCQIMKQMNDYEIELAEQYHVKFSRIHDQSLPAAACNGKIQDKIEQCCNKRGIKTMRLVSGAGHDCMNFRTVCPLGMIFVRSLNEGASHSLNEFSSKQDCTEGAQILLDLIMGSNVA